jgi:hypothetical protein
VIVFDIGCPQGHVFEAWFGSSEDYEAQRARGLIACPMCGSTEIDKAVMAPRVARKGNQQAGSSVPVTNDTPSPDQMKAMAEALARAQREMLKDSRWVGTGFADEARAMHLGEVDQGSIHGQTTIEEAKALIEEGIAVAPLPFPVRPPGQDN